MPTGLIQSQQGNDDWAPLRDGTVVELPSGSKGLSLRTADSGAIISFYGLAEARLAPHTMIVLTRASRPFTFGSGVQVDLDLREGRVWSRVHKLFDPEAGFRVHAGPVTANVRGTSFDVQTTATGSVVAVADAAVEIEGATLTHAAGLQEAPVIVSEGSLMAFDADGKVKYTRSIGDDMRQNDWFAPNLRQDQRFDAEARVMAENFIDSLGERPLDGLVASIIGLSERLHVWVAHPDEASRMDALQVLRRVAAMKRLADAGKAGLADEAWNALQRDIVAETEGAGHSRVSPIRHALQEGMFLMSEALPGSQEYPLKLDVEGAYIDMAKDDPAAYLHARLVGIDARLDEADKLIAASSLDDASNGLDAARDGIANVEREMDRTPAGASPERLAAVRSKLHVVKSREAGLRIRLATALQPPTGTMHVNDQAPAAPAATSTTP